MATSTKFNFPYEVFTPIEGKPTNTALQLLQRQLFTNVRAVDSPRGGGTHGHLAILLTDEKYLARTGVEFVIFVHPGTTPAAVVGATAAQIAEAIRAYKQAATDVTLYTRLNSAIYYSKRRYHLDTFKENMIKINKRS